MLAVIGRRELLATGAAAAAVGLLAACTSTSSSGPEPTPTGADDPDLALRESVVRAETVLIAAYEATLAAHPALRTQLAPFRDQHLAHRALVGVEGAVPAPSVPAPTVPASPDAAVAALAALERSAAAARGRDAVGAARWQLARELGLIGGSEAAHHALLRDPS